MIKSKKRVSVSLLVALTLMIAAAGFAQRHFMLASAVRPIVKINLSAALERDSRVLTLSQDTVARTGDVLDWTITSENTGGASAVDYKAVAHIPQGTIFVANSAKAENGARTVYSIDGGKSYFSQPLIEVKQMDGSTKRVPAPVSMYTDLRYEWSDPLAPGGKLSASYRVQVK